jgi:hypothetical protein
MEREMRYLLPLLLTLSLVGGVNAGTFRIIAEDAGGARLRIGYEGPSALGFGLDITLTNGATFHAIVSSNPSFTIHPSTMNIDLAGNIIDIGTPIAPASEPNTLGGLGTSGATIEMGYIPWFDMCFDSRDYNQDYIKDTRDLVLFLAKWLEQSALIDLSGDGFVNIADYGIFAEGHNAPNAPPVNLDELILLQLSGNGAATTTVTISLNSTFGGVADSLGSIPDVILPEPFVVAVPESPIVLPLDAEELVQTDLYDIDVGEHSVPSFADWNNDNLKDLIIGGRNGKVRVYLNGGSESNPSFSDYSYIQSNGADLVRTGDDSMGCFPRVVYWDADGRKDLLIGRADGKVEIFLNNGTDNDPVFDAGNFVMVGYPEENLDVGEHATPTFLDWNNDNKTDLIVGALDGKIHIYTNCGCGGAVPPQFDTSTPLGLIAQENGSDLVVPSHRSSPVIIDLDGDSKKDLLAGNANGQLLFYKKVETDSLPKFSDYSLVDSNDVPIDLPDLPHDLPSSRPFFCYWNEDTHPDVLLGASDGKVHLYKGKKDIGDIDGDGDVDFEDFALFASFWQQTNCGKCGDADFTSDGNVGPNDLREFAANWLFGAE